jgi:hypothetical protein
VGPVLTIYPGIWIDSEGCLHLDPVRACQAAGYDPTPENVQAMQEGAIDAFRAAGVIEPFTPIVEIDVDAN